MIVTVGPSGRDYTSLSAAEAGEQQDLTVLGEPCIFECDAFEDTTAVTFDGWTTSAANYLEVRAASGASAQMPWSTSAYRLSADDFFAAINCLEDYLRVTAIQIDNTRTPSSDGRNSGIRYIGAGELRVQRCLVRKSNGFHATADNALINCTSIGAGATVIVANCVGVGHYTGLSFYNNSANTLVAYNNTFRGASVYNYNLVLYGTGDTVRIKNNLGAAAGTADFYIESTPSTADYVDNASADSSAPADTSGGATLRSRTFTFVDASGGDLHLASTDVGATDVGTDLSADSAFALTIDFDGVTRSGTWDVGAHQYVAGGGGGGSYTLTADPGAFTLSGANAAMRAGRRLVADAGSFALTGVNAGLRVARRLTADSGSFALTGTDTTLRAARRLTADSGTFVLSGQVATMRAARRLAADSGAFALAGGDIAIVLGTTLTAESGAFVLSGADAALRRQLVCVALPGAFVLIGPDAALRRALRLTADRGSFALTGADVVLLRRRHLAAAGGAFAITGSNAALRRALRLVADLGAIALTGHDALLYVGAAAGPGPHPLRLRFDAVAKTLAFDAHRKTLALDGIEKQLTLET